MRKPRLWLGILVGLGLIVAIGIGIGQAGDDGTTAGAPPKPLSLAAVTAPLRGAPAELTALRARANELDGDGVKALDAQLRALRGHPVVVNLWASWCDPCLYELPFLQRQALKHGKQVAFLGVNSGDNTTDARKLTRRIPMPYPSFEDPRQSLTGRYKARGLPATAFYDASGKLVLVHQGRFASEAALAAEIDRYALGRG